MMTLVIQQIFNERGSSCVGQDSVAVASPRSHSVSQRASARVILSYSRTTVVNYGLKGLGLSPLSKSFLIPTLNQTGYVVRLLLLVTLGVGWHSVA